MIRFAAIIKSKTFQFNTNENGGLIRQLELKEAPKLQKFQPQKRAYAFEELSEGSTETDSPINITKKIEIKQFRQNYHQIERQIKYLSLHEQ